jgi:hypothetical protein
MITWPEALPKPSLGFAVTVDTAVARTKMDSGRVRQRQRFTRDFRRMSASWRLSDLQYGYFQSIYHHMLGSGADWFTMSLPMGDTFKEYTVRFVADTYQAKQDEATLYWAVSAQLETEDETAPWSAEDIDALLAADFDVDAFEGTVDELHTYVHVTLPTLLPA